MLLFYLLIIRLASASNASVLNSNANLDYEADLKHNEEDSEIETENQKFCSNLSGCNCTYPYDNIYHTFILSCFHDNPEDQVEIKITSFESFQTYIECEDESSFKLIPDLNDYYGNSTIVLKNCMVPKNQSISQITNKISKNMKHLTIKFEEKRENFNLDNNYFEGLSSLD